MELYEYIFENGILTFNTIEVIETSKLYKVKNKGEHFSNYGTQVRKEELPLTEMTFNEGIAILDNIDDKNCAIETIRKYYENRLNVAKNKLNEVQDILESFEQAIKREEELNNYLDVLNKNHSNFIKKWFETQDKSELDEYISHLTKEEKDALSIFLTMKFTKNIDKFMAESEEV